MTPAILTLRREIKDREDHILRIQAVCPHSTTERHISERQFFDDRPTEYTTHHHCLDCDKRWTS